ncbi:hypothetical protein [Zavarzinella formosa]|uniref:hypothetical protein n=1 Tax=Zavarzinella formosa TaxID=360055 RepID=UPI000317926D|nr:hypothetical protein [Zavarzinella formosa]
MKPNLVNGDTSGGEPAGLRSSPAVSPDVSAALRVLRNRSPEESLGVNTKNSLLRASIQAGIVTGVLFAALTIVPYVLAKVFPPAPKEVKQTPAETETTAPTTAPASTTKETAPTQTAKKTPDGPAVPPKTAGKKDIMDVLGETGAKPSNPRVNPLDKKEDDLLKDLK